MIKKVALSLDDFSVLNNRLDLLYKIKEHYPNFKVSMFTIPVDLHYEKDIQRIYRDAALEKIKECLDWIQIIPHGLTHMAKEMEKCDRGLFKYGVLPSIDEAFKKDGLPYEKGFKAPFWLWNQEIVDVLDEEGWWGGIDRNQPGMLSTKKFYKYSHSLEEPYYESNLETIKLHGHLDQVSANDLERCFLNIFKLPPDVEWVYVTDFIEEKK